MSRRPDQERMEALSEELVRLAFERTDNVDGAALIAVRCVRRVVHRHSVARQGIEGIPVDRETLLEAMGLGPTPEAPPDLARRQYDIAHSRFPEQFVVMAGEDVIRATPDEETALMAFDAAADAPGPFPPIIVYPDAPPPPEQPPTVRGRAAALDHPRSEGGSACSS